MELVGLSSSTVSHTTPSNTLMREVVDGGDIQRVVGVGYLVDLVLAILAREIVLFEE